MVLFEKLSESFGNRSHIHRTHQRQKAAGRIAKRRDFSFRINNRLVIKRINSTAGTETSRSNPMAHISRSNRPHHVVSASSANDNGRGNPILLRNSLSHYTTSLAARRKPGETFPYPTIYGTNNLVAPDPRSHIHQSRP